MRHIPLAVALGAAGLLAACTPLATYPPDSRAANPKAVVNEPIPTIMAETVLYCNAKYPVGGDPAICLPAGSSTKLYDRVIRLLGQGHPMTDPDEPAYHITEVRSRGLKAEVDVFVPRADGTYRYATMTFRAEPFEGYAHAATRWWKTGDQPAQPVLAHD
jgi:hypothetical protein